MSSVGAVAGSLCATAGAARFVAVFFAEVEVVLRVAGFFVVDRAVVVRVVDVGAGFIPPAAVDDDDAAPGFVVTRVDVDVDPPADVEVEVEPVGFVAVVGCGEGSGAVARATGVVPVFTPSRDSLCADSRSRKSRLSRVG